jgi:hypothetical protein
MADRGWQRRFDEPIRLPRGRQPVTLKDACTYIMKLPKAEHDAKEWQAAMEALLPVAEHDGPTMSRASASCELLTGTSTACSIPIERNIIGDGGAGAGSMSRSGRRIIMCMLLIAVVALIWSLLGH